MSHGEEQAALREALKATAVALKKSGLAFALGGGYASWAHGGPEPDHDVDFVITEADAERAAKVLRNAGLRVEQPPEDWLFKVFTEDAAMVDIIFRINGNPVDTALLERAQTYEVLSVQMPVISATDLVISKINALDEHTCDYSHLLPVARALREQVEWKRLREAVAGNDFGAVFLILLERLGIVDSCADNPDPTPS